MQPIFTGWRQSLALPATDSTRVPTAPAVAASRPLAETITLVPTAASPIAGIATLAPVADAIGVAGDVRSAALVADAGAAEPPALNADLIASLPHGALDALLPATRETANEPPVQSLWQTFGSPGAGPWRDTLRGGGQPDSELVRPGSLKSQARGTAREAGSEAGVSAAAIASSLAERARHSGLSQTEAAQLQKILRDGRFPGDAELVATLLETGNAADALRTFVELQALRSKHPHRFTPDIMRALTLGVGLPRTAAAEGREGILGMASALAAARALASMEQGNFDGMKLLLAEAATGFPGAPAAETADAQTERALILKAIAARGEALNAGVSNLEALNARLDITRFALHVRGMDAQRLIEIASPVDLDGDGADEALRQHWQNTSAPAVLQILRAEHDPIYAWSMHNVAVEPKPGHWFTDKVPVTNVADEQASMLEKTGTEATLRGEDPFSGSGMVTATMNKATNPVTGKPYERRSIGIGYVTLEKAVADIESALRAGRDVAISLSAPPGVSQRRALAVTDVRGYGPTLEVLVTDPWTGRTEWVSPVLMAIGHFGGALLTDYWL